MRWKRVAADRIQPPHGRYADWKTQIANDCSQQCVYCAISESRYGGLDNFHIDHFKPRSRFEELEQIIANLFLACAICNRFKSNDWPDDPLEDHSRPAYPDPSSHDYNELFTVDHPTYEVSGRYPAPTYVAERLYLNRPQLLLERRSFFLEERIDEFGNFAQRAWNALRETGSEESKTLLLEFLVRVIDLNKTFAQANRARPYELEDVRRD